MPGYGIADANGGSGLLPWSWATERLVQSHNYYLATTREDKRPHVMPVWGVWIENAFYFSSGRESRKARNLAANPYCSVCTEKLNESVVIEGTVEVVPSSSIPPNVADAYFAKYAWKLDPQIGSIYKVRPAIAFGIQESDFAGSATKWVFR
jgi:pyridoxine/pyridoxamine 5'-phosphate oxidase